MQNQEIISEVTLSNEEGIPTFTFLTQQYERLEYLFQYFPLEIIPVDVPTMRQLPLPPHIQLPEEASLRIEFSLDDVNPHALLWDMHLTWETRKEFTRFNHESKSIGIRIQDVHSKQAGFSKIESPYILDWSGLMGLAMYVRTTIGASGQDWDQSNAADILAGIKETIEKNGGYVTNLHAQMGLIYRTFGDFNQAIPCYIAEIKGAERPDGSFALSAMRAFSNLGVIYKKQQKYGRAIDCFNIALSMNPNYFEALFSIVGLLEDDDLIFQHLARAFRLRPNSELWGPLLHNMAAAVGQPPQNLFNHIQMKSQNIELETPPDFDLEAFHRLNIL